MVRIFFVLRGICTCSIELRVFHLAVMCVTIAVMIIRHPFNMIAAGPNADTMKVHLLRHVTSCVRDWGVYSVFQFERINQKLFHGNRNTSKEVSCAAVQHSLK